MMSPARNLPALPLPVVIVCTAAVCLTSIEALADETRTQADSWITFLSHRSGQDLLYRMRPDGPFLESYLKPVATNPPIRRLVSGARYSPDGTRIAAIESFPITRDNQIVPNRLVVIERETGDHRVIAEFEEGLRGPICWSPDGREVLFSRYLPPDDEREQMPEDWRRPRLRFGLPGVAGLAIWSVGVDGEDLRFVTSGWSPDWR